MKVKTKKVNVLEREVKQIARELRRRKQTLRMEENDCYSIWVTTLSIGNHLMIHSHQFRNFHLTIHSLFSCSIHSIAFVAACKGLDEVKTARLAFLS